MRSTSPYSGRMRENADQNNSKCGQFSRSEKCFPEKKSPLFGTPSYSSTEQKAADLVTFTEEILNGQLYFLCSAQKYFCGMTLYCNRDTDYIGSYDMSGDNK